MLTKGNKTSRLFFLIPLSAIALTVLNQYSSREGRRRNSPSTQNGQSLPRAEREQAKSGQSRHCDGDVEWSQKRHSQCFYASSRRSSAPRDEKAGYFFVEPAFRNGCRTGLFPREFPTYPRMKWCAVSATSPTTTGADAGKAAALAAGRGVIDGSGVGIAILDSGIDANHAQFAPSRQARGSSQASISPERTARTIRTDTAHL